MDHPRGGPAGLAKAGRFENETVVFLHTGGAQGLFGYRGEIVALWRSNEAAPTLQEDGERRP